MQKRATINMMCKVICDISTSHVRLEVRSAAANEDKNTRKDGNRRNQHIVVKSTAYVKANKVLCVGSFWSKNELEKVNHNTTIHTRFQSRQFVACSFFHSYPAARVQLATEQFCW